MITLTKQEGYSKDFITALNFLYKGKSNDNIKPVFTGVFIEGNKAITTDSRRLHIIESDFIRDFPGGLYAFEKIKGGYIIMEEIDGVFPDYKHVIPEYKTDENGYKLRSIITSPIDGVRVGRVLYHLKHLVNADFVYDTVKGIDSEWSIYEQEHETLSPVVLETTFNNDIILTSIIMPLKVK